MDIKTLLEAVEQSYAGPASAIVNVKSSKAGVDYGKLQGKLHGLVSKKLYEAISAGTSVNVDTLTENLMSIIKEEVDEADLIKQKPAEEGSDQEDDLTQDDSDIVEAINEILEGLEDEGNEEEQDLEEGEEDEDFEKEINEILEGLDDDGEEKEEGEEKDLDKEIQEILEGLEEDDEEGAMETALEARLSAIFEAAEEEEEVDVVSEIYELLEGADEDDEAGEDDQEDRTPTGGKGRAPEAGTVQPKQMGAGDELDQLTPAGGPERSVGVQQEADEDEEDEGEEPTVESILRELLEGEDEDEDAAKKIVNEILEGADDEEASAEDIKKKVESVLESKGLKLGKADITSLTEGVIDHMIKKMFAKK